MNHFLLHNWKYGAGAIVLSGGVLIAIVFYLTHNGPGPQRAQAREPANYTSHGEEDIQTAPSVVSVDVIHPQKGMDYEIEQPGSVNAFESVQLHAKASGFLREQNVDIGDKVKRGQVLALIAVPELDKQLQRNRASLEQAHARVHQMDARVTSAEAEHEAAKAAIIHAEAAYGSAQAWVRYYQRAYQRKKDLFTSNSIEEKLLDEAKEKLEAGLETERSAKAAIATATANLAASAAKIKQAQADVKGAQAEIKVAQAEMEKTQVLLDYAVITAPFDGEICHRYFFPGDYIRSAAEGATQPLLTIQRTDKLRVVVRLPDSAVPYLDKGDPATVRIDSLPGRKFAGRVSRKAGTEDPSTRLMRTEIDLPNPTGEISDGMYGKVKILLDRFPDLLSIPSSSVLRSKDGRTSVFVVKDGRLKLQEVRLSKDNGLRVAVVSGLALDDLVVRIPSAALTAGSEVEARLIDDPTTTDEEP
jgi:RND family efflux transporter MFP subunit